MFTVKIINPERDNTCRALTKLLDEAWKTCSQKDNLQNHFKKWAKEKYNYNVEYTTTKKGLLKIHIDTDEVFFVLKHG